MAYPIANLQDLIPPTMSSFFSAYAPYAGYVFMLQASFKYLKSSINYLLDPEANHMTLLIDVCGQRGMTQRNQVYDAAEVYLATKISPKTLVFQTTKTPEQKTPRLAVTTTQEITDTFENIKLKWRMIFPSDDDHHCSSDLSPRIELTFHKKHKDKVMDSYIPYVLAQAEAIKDAEAMNDDDKNLKLYSYNVKRSIQNQTTRGNWSCVDLEHPATFETIAMEPELKRMIIEDLDKFMKRREFYKRVGKPWKRGYLLYGPPGTGKSSLVAAMANHLHFNIYDLELTSFSSNEELRKALMSTTNRSIVVFEDIDCIEGSINRESTENKKFRVSEAKVTLSGLLNVLDGLWSSCGDERIVVLTTNHKERLDTALLRPGRMDMHIHMPYCTPRGFETLASNYLGIQDTGERHLGQEIEGLMESTNITPAEVCEELMKGEGEGDAALEGVVNLLKRKREESKVIVIEDERNKEPEIPNAIAKRQKTKDNNISKFFRKVSKKIGISRVRNGKRRRPGWP
ncbi:PREDICTED: peroxisomal biogenesis factor 6-like [Fragaria vesca subsp. vesca]|uniref:peroxisomal biogenesis factor 6-like n=1 Tax=Fragaria vesca subsp. vesca TaxID=101020 RepID=UPI0002C34D23|nr:PREDICTED: peroxisomal biogenesis factor 6-like [Fragaria vesca subsp. vesca]